MLNLIKPFTLVCQLAMPFRVRMNWKRFNEQFAWMSAESASFPHFCHAEKHVLKWVKLFSTFCEHFFIFSFAIFHIKFKSFQPCHFLKELLIIYCERLHCTSNWNLKSRNPATHILTFSNEAFSLKSFLIFSIKMLPLQISTLLQ